MSEKRFLLFFGAPAISVTLICATLMFLLLGSSEDSPKNEVEPPELTAANSAQLSIHAKSVSTIRGGTDLKTPTTFPSSEPKEPDYVASVLEQSLEEPANEESTSTLSLPGTDPVDPVSSKDTSSLRAAASETKVAAPPKREETAASESHDKPSWKAMALASNEKQPSPSLLKATTPGENVVTYGAKVRAFLARQPRTVGPPGSATVTFAISANGTLLYARIEHSSDNAALDEMALATVQNAAPFPPPPKTLNDEALSYSIQIGFRDPDALRTQN
jgi:periplasmic protein TonB